MSPTGSRALTPAGGPPTQPIHQHDRWSPGKLGVGLGGGGWASGSCTHRHPQDAGLGAILPLQFGCQIKAAGPPS